MFRWAFWSPDHVQRKKSRLWRYRASTAWPTSSAATTSWWSPQEVNWTPTILSLQIPSWSPSRLLSKRICLSEQRPAVCKGSVTGHHFLLCYGTISWQSCLTLTAPRPDEETKYSAERGGNPGLYLCLCRPASRTGECWCFTKPF